MPKTAYIDKNFRAKSLALIDRVNEIIEDYSAQGFNLTLRQLYYQLVSHDVIPNNLQSYNNLGVLVSDGRLAGLIDWYAIEDRTRNLRILTHWDSPKEIIDTAAKQFRIDKWKGQTYYVEVWVEKEALVEIVGMAANKYDTPFFACRGYVSQSEMWKAAQRLIAAQDEHEGLIVLHLGDHDPSGIDMTRDNRCRLELFGVDVEVHRIALNMEQVEEYNPPPNPAKITDSRAVGYIGKYGYSSWELDALEPRVLQKLIERNIAQFLDMDQYNVMLEFERAEKQRLIDITANWDK
jgi:hypothetical protein